jgi:hypothetical protein
MTSFYRRSWLGFGLCIVAVPLQFIAMDARLARQTLAAISIVVAIVGLTMLASAWWGRRHG